ncbi:hypothetical protein PUN28_001845 [Cardiocondyla obscurior]|uniref:Uncharacterized protein n=1 Tax=Cardiocondyla obscurior TaxID=286306 RepID=A0AAW2GRE9_9HYME
MPYQLPPLTRSHPRLVEARSIDGGLKTTPTFSQRPSLPRLLNIVSLRTLLHRLPNRPPLPRRLPLFLSPRLSLTPVVLHTSPSLRPSVPTTATKHERRRIFIVTSRAASSDLPPPIPPPNCAHPPPPCSCPSCLASRCVALPCSVPVHFRKKRPDESGRAVRK